MSKEEPFQVPQKMIDKIYEISGGPDKKNKGLILAVCNDNGDPVIYQQFEESIVQLGLTTSLMDYLTQTRKANQILDDL